MWKLVRAAWDWIGKIADHWGRVGVLATGVGFLIVVVTVLRRWFGPLGAGFIALGTVVILLGVGLFLFGRSQVTHQPLPEQESTPETQPPPTADKLREALTLDYWGKQRYKASAEWNSREHQAYLVLHRLDAGMAQDFRVTVFDPTGLAFEKGTFGAADEFVSVFFPRDFRNRDHRDIPEPLIQGDYAVKWLALVGDGTMGEVGSSQFTVLHEPDIAVTLHETAQIQKIPGQPDGPLEPAGQARVWFTTGEFLATDDETKRNRRLISTSSIGAPQKVQMVKPYLGKVIDDVPSEIVIGGGILRITRMDARGIELEEHGVQPNISVELEVYAD